MNRRIRKKWKCRNNFRHYSKYNELIGQSVWHLVKHVIWYNGKVHITVKPRYRYLIKNSYGIKPYFMHIDIAQKSDMTSQWYPFEKYTSAGLTGMYNGGNSYE